MEDRGKQSIIAMDINNVRLVKGHLLPRKGKEEMRKHSVTQYLLVYSARNSLRSGAHNPPGCTCYGRS